MGDGWLVAFDSAADAVSCALETQQKLAGHDVLQVRIGLHIGDVTYADGDVFGDGINIAARLQEIAEPNTIVISETAKRSIDGKLAAGFASMGQQHLKNIADPVSVFGWGMSEVAKKPTHLTLPEKPSIAVLPFDNMSGDDEQEYFADGIAEDIITALSKFQWLFVIARNSTFTYKGSSVDLTQVAREFGVRYILEGSVRRSGNRVRITGQLIDGSNGSHLWAERYDRDLDDIFELQDEITETIVGQIDTEVRTSELERARRKPPSNIDAWTLYQHGLFHLYKITKSDNPTAIDFFNQAIEQDPNFCLPHAGLAYCYYLDAMQGYTTTPGESLVKAVAAGEQAVRLDEKECFAHFTLSRALALIGQGERAIAAAQRAVALNANFAHGYYGLGFVMDWCGRGAEGISPLELAIRLSPQDPLMWAIKSVLAGCLNSDGQHKMAENTAREAVNLRPEQLWPHLQLAEALFMQDRLEEARLACDKALEINPDLSLSTLRAMLATSAPAGLDHMIDVYGKIGLPE